MSETITPIVLTASNPLASAREFLASRRTADGEDIFRWYAGDWYKWENAAYHQVEDDGIRRAVYLWLEKQCEIVKRDDEEKKVPFTPNKSRVDGILDALRAEALVKAATLMPSFLDDRKVEPRECIATKNALVHLPTFAAGGKHYREEPTPLYFSTVALPFDFTDNTPEPTAWMTFLLQVFDGDAECIQTLQEWFGYCLTPDTRQQKMLLLYGPKRAGKGTIARVLTALVGTENVASPTLCSMTTNFGMWPLVGKPLAIIGDARLSGRSDLAIIAERLLSVSGEDRITIDRKNREPITVTLPTRIMILSNELPRLADASGTLASRFLCLQGRQSFYGCEDLGLGTRLVAELPGILHWAIAGWKRLHTQGRFTEPASSRAAMEELDELGSPIITFVRECCVVQAGLQIGRDRLFKVWQRWCSDQGREHPSPSNVFGRDLKAAYPRIGSTHPRVDGERQRLYEGIGLSEEGQRHDY